MHLMWLTNNEVRIAQLFGPSSGRKVFVKPRLANVYTCSLDCFLRLLMDSLLPTLRLYVKVQVQFSGKVHKTFFNAKRS